MKRYLNILLVLSLVAGGVACQSEQAHEHEAETAAAETTYTCPMHPQVVQDEPGNCPICGMKLVPQAAAQTDAIEVTDDLSFLLQPTNQTVIANIATIQPEKKTVEASVQMEGIITYDERRVYSIPARVGGRIEKLYVKYNFQPIHKGEKLLEIYSPELVTAQKELLYLVSSAPEDQELIRSARQKLLLLGATEAQVQRLMRTGEPSYTFTLYSPYDGYVVGLNTTAPSAIPSQTSITAPAGGGMGGGMPRSAAPTAMAAQEIQLREGMYVSTGQPLLRVVNPKQLWAEFNVPAGREAALAKGAPVQITFPQVPDEKLKAKVDFLEPFYEAGENFAKLRVYLPGDQRLARVGQLVSAEATYTTAPALWVPREAVLDVGTRSVVFVSQNGVFKPVAVTAGITENGQVQVLEGLEPNSPIAANAHYLVDSESFVKVENVQDRPE